MFDSTWYSSELNRKARLASLEAQLKERKKVASRFKEYEALAETDKHAAEILAEMKRLAGE